METAWYEQSGPDRRIWWWAIEHLGHPAYYLRTLLPGDFAPDQRGPLSRHACGLSGRLELVDPVRCGTCGQVPAVGDLEAIERKTGRADFLAARRRGHAPWGPPTDPDSCWLCSDRQRRALIVVPAAGVIRSQCVVPAEPGAILRLCLGCARHVEAVARVR